MKTKPIPRESPAALSYTPIFLQQHSPKLLSNFKFWYDFPQIGASLGKIIGVLLIVKVLMSVWRKRLVITSVSLSIMGITGCSESKLSQCKRLIELVNQGNFLIEKDKGTQVTTSLQLAKDLQKVTSNLVKQEFKDPQLTEFKASFVKIFEDFSQQIDKAGKALGASKVAEASTDGRFKIQKAREDIDVALKKAATVAKESDTLAEKLNQYCSQPEE